MCKVLVIAAPRNFRDEELFETVRLLEEAGYETVIASTITGPIRGSEGGWTRSQILIAQARVRHYCAVVFIGGWGAVALHDDLTAQRLAKAAFDAGLVLGAICVAPVILARAGLLKDKPATCYETEAEKLRSMGVDYTGNMVEVAGRVVTGNGPAAASEFARTLIKLIHAQGEE